MDLQNKPAYQTRVELAEMQAARHHFEDAPAVERLKIVVDHYCRVAVLCLHIKKLIEQYHYRPTDEGMILLTKLNSDFRNDYVHSFGIEPPTALYGLTK